MALCRRALKPGKMKGSSETRDLAQTALVGMCMRVLYSIGPVPDFAAEPLPIGVNLKA